MINCTFRFICQFRGCGETKISNDFILDVSNNLAHFRQHVVTIGIEDLIYANEFLSYSNKTKLIFGVVENFDFQTLDFNEEILRFINHVHINNNLNERNLIEDLNQDIPLNVNYGPLPKLEHYRNSLTEMDKTILTKVILLPQTLISTSYLNKKFKFCVVKAIEIFQALENLGFGIYMSKDDKDNDLKLHCFHKISFENIEQNQDISLSCSALGITMKKLLGSTEIFTAPEAPVVQGGILHSFSNLIRDSQLRDSLDGAREAFDLNLRTDLSDNSDEFTNTNDSIPSVLKTKYTSFMVKQDKNKIKASNEDLIVSTINSDIKADPVIEYKMSPNK